MARKEEAISRTAYRYFVKGVRANMAKRTFEDFSVCEYSFSPLSKEEIAERLYIQTEAIDSVKEECVKVVITLKDAMRYGKIEAIDKDEKPET